MADVKTPPKKPMARCAERVTEARMASEWAGAFWFRGKTTLTTSGNPTAGTVVDSLFLHPFGLVVLFNGRRYCVPAAHVQAVVIADDEA